MRSLPWLLAATVLAGCSTVKVDTEYDPKAAFTEYKTYAWNPAPAGPDEIATARNPAVRAMIVAAVDREMERKGLVKVGVDQSPSFIVTALGSAQRRIEVTDYGYSYGGSYMYGRGYPVSEVRDYHVGTLLLDFSDARTRQLFWRGVASGAIEDASTIRATIDDAARKLLDAYPPPRSG